MPSFLLTIGLSDRLLQRRASQRAAVRKWRAVLVLTAGTVGFVVSFVMLREAIGADSPWLYLFLMFCFLGMAKLAEPLFTLRMAGRLRPIRSWERSGTVYRALGVKAFGRLLRSTPLRYLNLQVYLLRQRADPEHVLRPVRERLSRHTGRSGTSAHRSTATSGEPRAGHRTSGKQCSTT